MAFFGKRVPTGRIEIDGGSVCAISPQVQRRMQRIKDNYAELSEVLSDLEIKIENDPSLRELDAQLTKEALRAGESFEQKAGAKRKRKYKRRSTAPNKPR